MPSRLYNAGRVVGSMLSRFGGGAARGETTLQRLLRTNPRAAEMAKTAEKSVHPVGEGPVYDNLNRVANQDIAEATRQVEEGIRGPWYKRAGQRISGRAAGVDITGVDPMTTESAKVASAHIQTSRGGGLFEKVITPQPLAFNMTESAKLNPKSIISTARSTAAESVLDPFDDAATALRTRFGIADDASEEAISKALSMKDLSFAERKGTLLGITQGERDIMTGVTKTVRAGARAEAGRFAKSMFTGNDYLQVPRGTEEIITNLNLRGGAANAQFGDIYRTATSGEVWRARAPWILGGAAILGAKGAIEFGRIGEEEGSPNITGTAPLNSDPQMMLSLSANKRAF